LEITTRKLYTNALVGLNGNGPRMIESSLGGRSRKMGRSPKTIDKKQEERYSRETKG